jgi:hypothetical protein
MAGYAPAKYVGLGGMDPSAPAGGTKLDIGMPYGLMARNATLMKGGKRRSQRKHRKQRKQTRRQRKQRKQHGGFLPSIGEGFAAAAAKYAAPIALLGLYKLFNKPTRKRSRSTRRR